MKNNYNLWARVHSGVILSVIYEVIWYISSEINKSDEYDLVWLLFIIPALSLVWGSIAGLSIFDPEKKYTFLKYPGSVLVVVFILFSFLKSIEFIYLEDGVVSVASVLSYALFMSIEYIVIPFSVGYGLALFISTGNKLFQK